MTDVEQRIEMLRRSMEGWNKWGQVRPNSDLTSADFVVANFSGAIFSGADFSGTDLRSTIFMGADFSDANLRGTIFMDANLDMANLRNADLNGADLRTASLVGAKLSGTDLSYARLWETVFMNVDLSLVKGLDTVIHDGPSCVDVNSVILPVDETTRKHFLRGVGFSDVAIDYLPSILTPAIQYHSLFLSYSHYDQGFTKQLHNDLQNRGPRVAKRDTMDPKG